MLHIPARGLAANHFHDDGARRRDSVDWAQRLTEAVGVGDSDLHDKHWFYAQYSRRKKARSVAGLCSLISFFVLYFTTWKIIGSLTL